MALIEFIRFWHFIYIFQIPIIEFDVDEVNIDLNEIKIIFYFIEDALWCDDVFQQVPY